MELNGTNAITLKNSTPQPFILILQQNAQTLDSIFFVRQTPNFTKPVVTMTARELK